MMAFLLLMEQMWWAVHQLYPTASYRTANIHRSGTSFCYSAQHLDGKRVPVTTTGHPPSLGCRRDLKHHATRCLPLWQAAKHWASILRELPQTNLNRRWLFPAHFENSHQQLPFQTVIFKLISFRGSHILNQQSRTVSQCFPQKWWTTCKILYLYDRKTTVNARQPPKTCYVFSLYIHTQAHESQD